MVGHGYSGGSSSWPAKITPVDGIDGGDTWCSKVPSTSQCLINLDSLRHCRTRQRGSLIAEVTIAPALWGPKTTLVKTIQCLMEEPLVPWVAGAIPQSNKQ